jgi:hypothetical protein
LIVAKELHNGHPNQDVIVQDQDGLNVRRLAVAVGHRHARILPSRRLIAVLWEGELRLSDLAGGVCGQRSVTHPMAIRRERLRAKRAAKQKRA